MKILIVEDDASLRELMLRDLSRENYIVETASDFNSADARIAAYNYDCILLDIMLPGGSGLKLLEHIKKLRRKDNVIIISAKDSTEDKITGLDNGADDYIAKPFELSELKARIKSVLRRSMGGGDMSLNMGNVTVHTDSRIVSVDGHVLPLLKKEYDILLYFIQHPNHLVDKSDLAEAVWGDHADGVDNYQFLYAQMKNLRKKLGEAGAAIEIKAVYGFGYKLTSTEG